MRIGSPLLANEEMMPVAFRLSAVTSSVFISGTLVILFEVASAAILK
jgi:hypothetical protein